ncbi:MAG: hypothetical protein UDT90_02515, partial [Lachnospiraceae bacterium]|nr:hypothetical protein [Lachnospiraceae bacterium]
WGGSIANLTTEALLPSERFVFESSWLYYFTHYFLRYRSFAHCQKLLVCPESLKWNSLSSQQTEHEKNRGKVTEIQCRHCASVFLLS